MQLPANYVVKQNIGPQHAAKVVRAELPPRALAYFKKPALSPGWSLNGVNHSQTTTHM
jgi:hypothetical protein